MRKLFDIRFSYKHCNFSRVCLLVKMASKTVTRSIDECSNEEELLRDEMESTNTVKKLNDYELGRLALKRLHADTASPPFLKRPKTTTESAMNRPTRQILANCFRLLVRRLKRRRPGTPGKAF